MKSGVEDGDVRHVRQYPPCLVEGSERRRVVKGGDQREIADLVLDLSVDDDRRLEASAAVDDPVSDGADVAADVVVRLDPVAALVRRDEVELQAGGAGVDYEDVQDANRTGSILTSVSTAMEDMIASLARHQSQNAPMGTA
jgi:hypothetical protein